VTRPASSPATTTDIHAAAVEHAGLAARAAYLGWRHLRSEYSQDIDTVLATLETGGPWTWTLPMGAMASSEADGADVAASESLQYVCATTMDEIRQQYVDMRTAVELWDWISMTDLRSSWYMVTHGVGSLIEKPAGNVFQVESVTMFPIGTDGILGEVQIGAIANERPNRWPEVPTGDGHVPFPGKRLEATVLHNEFMAAIRAQDAPRVAATMRPNVATAIRSYLTDDYEMANLTGAGALEDYYRALFDRVEVLELRLVNRIVESWFVFAELHWVVRHRAGTGDVVEFCTADIAPIDADGRFWVRTGVGTNPQATAPGRLAPYLDERGPIDKQGWEFDLIGG
jgi:hypothetical protein